MQEISATRTLYEATAVLKDLQLQGPELAPVHELGRAALKAVLEEQARLRARLEAEPVRFFVREYQSLMDRARCALAGFVGADPLDLVFVPNATTALNTVLRSLEPELEEGDELVTTDHLDSPKKRKDWAHEGKHRLLQTEVYRW